MRLGCSAKSFLLESMLLSGLIASGCNSRSKDPAEKVNSADTPAKVAASVIELRLRDVTASSGVNAVYRNGREAGENSILESLGGGVAIFDFDRDGVSDLCFPGGGRFGPDRQISGLPTSLWRGWGSLKFQEVGSLARIAEAKFYSHGCIAGDFNNDGFADLVVTGYGGLQLFRNRGDGTFQEEAVSAGMNDDQWSSSAAWGDFNGDGNLDLYVAHYVNWSWENHPSCFSAEGTVPDVCGPREFEPLDDLLYFSNGDGTFRPAASEAGLISGGKGLGVVAADVNSDGRLDIYVANDTTHNFLYINKGAGVFEESGFVSGTAVDEQGVPNGSMGIAVLDFDSNLRPDIWVANYENETFALYRNEGESNFVSVSESAGITSLGGLYVGFGTVSPDLELDGDEDIVVANGHVMYHTDRRPGPQEPILLRNGGQSRFARESFPPGSYFSQGHWGRGLAQGDLDGNGLTDLVFSNTNEPAAIVANETETPHEPLTTRLVGVRSNRDGIGARLILETTAGRFFRTICGGGSYLSQSDYAQIWGIPSGAKVEGLTVYWPSGAVQKIDTPSIDTAGIIIEPAAVPY